MTSTGMVWERGVGRGGERGTYLSELKDSPCEDLRFMGDLHRHGLGEGVGRGGRERG